MSPAVSVIIPAYNAGKYIADTLQSVLDQSFKDLEVIIIDDGSVDNTANIIKEKFNDGRIRYFHQVNSGVSIARNKGIELSNGNYISFLDADDLWHKYNLKEKIKLLESKDVKWVFGNSVQLDESGSEIKTEAAYEGPDLVRNILLWEGNTVPNICSNALISRSCFNEGVQLDTNLSTSADVDLALTLATKYKYSKVTSPPIYYRVLSNSMSRNVALMERDFIALYKKAEKLDLFQSYWFKKKCFSNMYLILAGSWWVNGKNRSRGLLFMIKSLISYPPNILKLLKKIW